jgi:hypothetical protein
MQLVKPGWRPWLRIEAKAILFFALVGGAAYLAYHAAVWLLE